MVKHTTETFQMVLADKLGSEYRLISEYVNYRTHITIHHEVCDLSYQVSPAKVQQGRRCPHCYSNHRKDTEWYKEQVFKLEGTLYSVLGEYQNYRTHILMKHEACGHEFETKPSHFLNNRRCPKCRLSKGEQMVGKVLKAFNLEYSIQAKFDDCRHIQCLPFDFAVYTPQGELLSLIEFDGEQHFKAVKAFGDKKAFLRRLRNDKIKDDYSKGKGIPLLRIPYFEERPKTMLMNFLVMVLMEHHAYQKPNFKKAQA